MYVFELLSMLIDKMNDIETRHLQGQFILELLLYLFAAQRRHIFNI